MSGVRRARTQPATLLRRILELQIAMALGALMCLLVGRSIADATSLRSVYAPGTVLFFFGDVFFLTAPVVAWLLLRGCRARHSQELTVAMLAPVVGIVVVGELTKSPYLFWLVTAMYPAMSLGMLAYLIHRRGPNGDGALTPLGDPWQFVARRDPNG